MFNKKFFFSICSSPIKKITVNKKGFSLIGVLVAAVVGVIVVMGISQLFVTMASQVKRIEDRSRLNSLYDFIRRELSYANSCEKTLDNHKNSLFSAVSSLHFQQIKNDSGVNIIDLSNTSLMESKYALKGALFFKLKWETGASCPSSTSPTSPCIQTWDLSLVTQSLVHDVTVFNKPEHLLLINIKFLTSNIFECP